MSNPNFGDYENMRRPQNGRMSAANQPYRKPTPRPSTDELAPYGAANYVSHGSKTRAHRHVRKPIIAGIAAIIALLLIVPGTALAVSAKNAMDDARILMNQGSALVSQIQSGDVQGAQRTATNLNSIAKELDANVNGPLWVPLTFVPVYGDDVKSIRTLAEVANKLSEQVLIPIAQGLSTDGNARLFVDGGFNIPVIQAMLTPIGAASDTIRECARQVNELSEPHIVQLMSPVMTVKSLMSVLSEVTGYASDLSLTRWYNIYPYSLRNGKEKAMANVIAVAEHVLKRLGSSSTMKLQKIVYYSQAYHLVRYGQPLFSERIEAWRNGPVVRDLYDLHAHEFVISDGYFGADLTGRLQEYEIATIDHVVNVLGNRTGRELSELTHSEAPWRDARGGIPADWGSNSLISVEAIKDYYGSPACANPVFAN